MVSRSLHLILRTKNTALRSAKPKTSNEALQLIQAMPRSAHKQDRTFGQPHVETLNNRRRNTLASKHLFGNSSHFVGECVNTTEHSLLCRVFNDGGSHEIPAQGIGVFLLVVIWPSISVEVGIRIGL